jgi:prepilin-type N-terminal cleavage/methylation domain-containing protein
MKTKPTPPAEGGFSLVEILVTMVLLAITLMCLMPVSMRVARLGAQATVSAQRTAILAGEIQRIERLSYSSLTAGTTCTDYPLADFAHTTCVTVTEVDASNKQVSVVVTPYVSGVADTSTVALSRGTRFNPLSP